MLHTSKQMNVSTPSDALTDLHIAIKYGQIEDLKKYFSKEKYLAAINSVINNPYDNEIHRKTLAILAAESANKDILQLLIEKKADIYQADPAGQTPLSIAIENNNENMIAILLNEYEKGLNVSKGIESYTKVISSLEKIPEEFLLKIKSLVDRYNKKSLSIVEYTDDKEKSVKRYSRLNSALLRILKQREKKIDQEANDKTIIERVAAPDVKVEKKLGFIELLSKYIGFNLFGKSKSNSKQNFISFSLFGKPKKPQNKLDVDQINTSDTKADVAFKLACKAYRRESEATGSIMQQRERNREFIAKSIRSAGFGTMKSESPLPRCRRRGAK